MNAQRRPQDLARWLLSHLDATYNLARWLVDDPGLADRVVHEAFVRARETHATSGGARDRAWLLQIVRDAAHGRLAQRFGADGSSGREAPASESEGTGTDRDAGAARAPSRRNAGAAPAEALAALPVHLRECIVLREQERLSYEEIARITGVSAGAVMTRLSRARHALRAAFVDDSAQTGPKHAGPRKLADEPSFDGA